jgi:thioredoxin reductase (NADPH)
MSTHHRVIIIGSGPAGLTAAIYAARANLAPFVIEGEPSSTSDQPGGQLMLTTDVENFPGFPEGIMGPELMMRFRDQAARFGATFLTGKATKVEFGEKPLKVHVRDQVFTADSVIISTGAQSLMLGLEAEERLIGHGLSTCATCDGFFFRGKEIASKVTLIHRRDSFRASKIMQDRALNNPKIEMLWNTAVTDIVGKDQLESISLKNTVTGAESSMNVAGLFIAIGHRPNTDVFKGVIDMEDSGYLITRPDSTYTNIEGVFACGDVKDHVYRQAITAAGSGCMAAIDTERWLEHQH